MAGIPDAKTLHKVMAFKKKNKIEIKEKVNIFDETSGEISQELLVSTLESLQGKKAPKNIKTSTLFTKIGEELEKLEDKKKAELKKAETKKEKGDELDEDDDKDL